MQPLTVSISTAAQSIGICRASVYNLINRGELEAVKVGRRRLIKMDSIRALVGKAA